MLTPLTYEAALDAAPEALFIVDGAGTIRYANPRAAALFGYARAALSGQPFARLAPLRAGAPLEAHRQDGSTLAVELILTPLEAAPNRLTLCTVRETPSAVAAALADSERRLRESEHRMRAITDNIPVSIALFDADEVVRFANSEFRRLNRSAGPVEGRRAVEVLPEHVYQVSAPARVQALAGETVHFLVKPVISGVERIREVTYVPFRDSQGEVVGVCGIGYDVTERETALKALASREAKLSGIFAAMAEGLVVENHEGRIIEANKAAEVVMGLPREQIVGRTSLDPHWQAIREDGSHYPGPEHPVMRTLRTGVPIRDGILGIRAQNGDIRWLSVNTQALPAEGPPSEDTGAVIATFLDVTPQRIAFERIRALAQRLESAREYERREVSQLLHEGVSQDLFALSLTVKFLAGQAKDRPGVLEACRELEQGFAKCLADLRQLANDLRPTSLAHLHIGTALKEHARYFGRLSGLAIQVSEDDDLPVLDEATRLLLFRAAQEGLTNVARHGKATSVQIKLWATLERIHMSVVDDGIGIRPDALSKTGSLGLLGLQERFRAAGGGLRIAGHDSAGTLLSVHLPLERPGSAAAATTLGAQGAAPPI